MTLDASAADGATVVAPDSGIILGEMGLLQRVFTRLVSCHGGDERSGWRKPWCWRVEGERRSHHHGEEQASGGALAQMPYTDDDTVRGGGLVALFSRASILSAH